MKFSGLPHAFGEAGDGKRGGVGAQPERRLHEVFDLLEDLLLSSGFSRRLDDEVAAAQVVASAVGLIRASVSSALTRVIFAGPTAFSRSRASTPCPGRPLHR